MRLVLNDPLAEVRVTLTAEGGSCARARQVVRDAATSWGLSEDLADDAQLVVTELVSNGIDHGEGLITLTVSRRNSGMLVEVHDESSKQPLVRPVDPSSARGRGMQLVQALSARWGTTPDPRGKVVWAELES
ncbi:ATP-binding protein [Lentzea nigeriaca]|uniref:ATP-binding protein n=1 Tax=Lentzea nigeriaca TaxID=1128665 RepID=UPI001EF8CC36|nr:ATP-binding protein [Lentzea nigeriaca]MBM7863183.1 anti-sigma regulatory factor (Ser/Thr protein kinase) [Lentzea nigeriaca]